MGEPIAEGSAERLTVKINIIAIEHARIFVESANIVTILFTNIPPSDTAEACIDRMAQVARTVIARLTETRRSSHDVGGSISRDESSRGNLPWY